MQLSEIQLSEELTNLIIDAETILKIFKIKYTSSNNSNSTTHTAISMVAQVKDDDNKNQIKIFS